MRLIRNNEKIAIYENEDFIEEYSFDDEITFSGLIGALCKKDFETKISFSDDLGEKSEAEKTLSSVIAELISDYNNKVDEYSEFVSSKQQNNENN